MIPFLTKQAQRTIVMCAIDLVFNRNETTFICLSPTLRKAYRDIHCKVTFGFKYILNCFQKLHIQLIQIEYLF